MSNFQRNETAAREAIGRRDDLQEAENLELYQGEKADIEKILRGYRDELFGDTDPISKEMYETAAGALKAGSLSAYRDACHALWERKHAAPPLAGH